MSKQSKIAFDLGNNSLKAAFWKKGKLEVRELLLPEHLVEEDNIPMPHAFSAFLKKKRREFRLPGGPAGLILPASQVICRLVTMPRMSVEQLMLNLPYEFSDFIHEEPHQYYCDYALCQEPPQIGQEEGEDEPAPLTMMAAAVERRQVQNAIRLFGGGGFTLRRMLPQEMALIQLVKARRQARPQDPGEYCFIDLGYLSTRIFVIQEDRIQATRRIPVGCRELDNVVADLLNVDRFLADSYKRGNHQGILEDPRCVEVYEHIAVEALKLVNFYHFTYRQNQLSGVYLIGGGAEIGPLCRTLEDTLGLPALPVDGLIPGWEGEDVSPAPFVSAVGMLLDPEEEG